MKQLLSLFLFLLPCLALAQYPSNGNQKITLGEQTSADGLVFRGVAATDTVRKPSIDTMAYMVLDTTTNIIWHYKKATSNAWLRLNLLPSDTASMLTNYYRSGRTGIIQASDVPTLNQNTTGSAATLTTSRTFQTNLASTSTASFNGSANVTPGVTGILPVANGGTGASVRTFVDTINAQTVNGAKTFTSALTATRFNPTANTATGTGMYLPKTNTIGITSNGTNQMAIAPKGISIFKSDTVQNLYVAPMIEIGAQGLIYSANGAAGRFNDYTFGMGFYFDAGGTQKYMATTDVNITHQPVKISFYQGSITFENAVGGTKDNTLTFINRMKLDENGKLGIGETNPSQVLHVVGNARITAVGSGTFSNNLNITSDGTLTTATSDEKFKYNIRPLNYGLETLLQLKPVNFQWIEGEENDLGFIAQDVAEIIPEAVNTNWNSDLLFRYESLIPVLTKAIQEQQALIKALEQRIINLENK